MLKIQEKGTAAIAYNHTCPQSQQIDEIRLHLAATGGAVENFIITIDDLAGSEYDVPISTTAMNAVQDVVYQPTRPHKLVKGDIVKITYANTNSRAWGLTIIMDNI